MANISSAKLRSIAGSVVSKAAVQSEIASRDAVVKRAQFDKAKADKASKKQMMMIVAVGGGIALLYYMSKRKKK